MGSDQKNAIISLDSVTKRYGQTVGVADLTFTLQRGIIFGFLGPNGAGKTTTIRLILDLLRPSSGHIVILGFPLPDVTTTIRQRCGYLAGDFSAYSHMTAAEYLHFIAAMRRRPAPSDLSLVERFHLNDSLNRKIRHLSHGNLQKLGIIQAFFHKPELVILDEPTSGLDPLVKAEFYDFLFEYQREGKTVFFSSHDLAEVERISNRVGIIRDGRLVALENIEDLKKNRIRRLRILLRSPLDSLSIPQATLLRQKGREYEYQFQGEVSRLLEILSGLPIEDFDFPEPNLEDIFMVYYGKNRHD
ncbi:MAG: ABC transporter ATP-binding protein [Calditrichaeota bacterium]|nr:ABC transporter ATP-binding protein [Calditrichota bacterium]